jgi:hypothetical protein
MPEAARHSKPKAPARRLGVPVLAAATLAGVAAAFVFLHIGSAPASHAGDAQAVTTAATGLSRAETTVDAHYAVTAHMLGGNDQGLRRRYLASLAAARSVRQQAAAQRAAARHAAARRAAQAQGAPPAATQPPAAQQPAATQQPAAQPSPSPSPAATVPSSGTDAAHSALGVCIRNAEEGGSYAWGPGNGGGAYQFALGTWENYGGAASEFGVAGPAYQDQIFDNAIAAGGASNWTAYDGC